MDAIALIPARGGSKGIKNKNIVPLAGKPLLQYAVEAGRGCGVGARIVVSSDAAPILQTAQALGAEALERPAALATDMAGSDAVIAHVIEALGAGADAERPIVLLQPTSPLRTAAHVDAALALWRQRRPACVISVFEPAEHPAKSFRVGDNGMLTGLFGPGAPFQPRQSLPRALMPNGAIYIFSVGAFLAAGAIPRTGLLPFVMDRESSIDIDCMQDLAEAERYLQEKRHD